MSAADAAGRRAFLRSACRHCAGYGALGLGAAAWAQAPADWKAPPRFLRPSLESDEGGLWSMMDREETRLRRGPLVVRDPVLTEYLRDVLCRLGGEHCADVRVYVLRTAQFNASMAPNGSMQVWSGLLLRVDNEAQLAAVLGHELGHYLERHTVERMRDLKNKAAAVTALSFFGLPGALAALGVAASAMGFSRDQETRADEIGMRLMRDAGYDGRQAAQIWDDLLAELKIRGGEDVGKRSPMFASHPPAGDRRDALLKIAGEGGGVLRAEELERVTAPHRLDWLAKAPPELFRSLGLLQRSRQDGAAATAAFEKYLALAPDAGDAGLIKSYLTEVK